MKPSTSGDLIYTLSNFTGEVTLSTCHDQTTFNSLIQVFNDTVAGSFVAGNDDGDNFASDCLRQSGENVSSDRCLEHGYYDYGGGCDHSYDGGDDYSYYGGNGYSYGGGDDYSYDGGNDYSYGDGDDYIYFGDDDDYGYREDDFKYAMKRLTFNAVGIETYIILVAGCDGIEGEFKLSAECSDTSNIPE